MDKTKGKIDLSLIVCCYNEGSVLPDNLNRLNGYLEHTTLAYELVFVDDCSVDDTKENIQRFVESNPTVKTKCIFHSANRGRGAAVKSGYQVSEGQIVGFIDIDLEVAEHYILSCCIAISVDGYDVCIGSRVYKVNLLPGSILRHLMSYSYSHLAGKLLNIKTQDTETGYKFFNRHTAGHLIPEAHSNHWFWDTEIIILCEKAGLKIGHVNCLFMRNKEKKSTVKIFRDAIYYLNEIYRYHKLGGGQRK